MQYSLMKNIFNHVIEHRNNFQIINNATAHFKAYIYDDQGNYLIGGEQVAEFIKDSVELMRKGVAK